MVSYSEAKEVSCPKCKATIGESCVAAQKDPVWVGDRYVRPGDEIRTPHQERRDRWKRMYGVIA